MKKVVIVSLAGLLAACSSSKYTVDVKSESFREDYTPVVVAQEPVVTSEPVMIAESNVTPTQTPIIANSAPVITETKSQPTPVATRQEPVVKIVPPSKSQSKNNYRFGYTLQVVAVGSKDKVEQFSSKLPRSGQPIWENYKVVNGTKWYSVLYGDYATRTEAKAAISTLPAEFKQLKPFVKSIDKIKQSDYPTLTKLN
ncbi:SPOR domain-containing protein [Vibrio hippocampi]|uniref:Cell division protein DamX n=1 Tax=Vibrio hippocampi TaxID=654686 RepID=A0ABM8ZNS1_9VIBR|nr:SPOR domain-containing protein [Vibrio hippocampi]CAH0529631.1 Cell division protein DamX [Vibrio hippocampi]